MFWKKLLLIGDSNIQYGFSENGKWVSLLANKLQRRCDVINRGLSGYNTRHLKILTPKILSEFPVESICGVIFTLGSNDSSSNTTQNVPLDEYKNNLKEILTQILNYGIKKETLIVLSSPRIDEKTWTTFCGEESTHLDHLVKDYSNCCYELCSQLGIKCIHLYNLMSKTEDYRKYLFDGLHYSQLGSQLVFDNIEPIIDDLFIKNDSLEMNFPYWRNLNNHPDITIDELPQYSKK